MGAGDGTNSSKGQVNFLEELSKRKMASPEARMSAIEANKAKNASPKNGNANDKYADLNGNIYIYLKSSYIHLRKIRLG
jgi:hypothetical protein